MSRKKPPVKALDWLERRIIRRVGGILLNADSWDVKMQEHQTYIWVAGEEGRELRSVPTRWTRFSASTVTDDGHKIRILVALDTRQDYSSLRVFTKVQKVGVPCWQSVNIRWHHFFKFKDGEPVPFDKLKTEWIPQIEAMLIGAGISVMRRPHGGTAKDQPDDQPDGSG